MVRFSDMLGGDGERDDAQAATAARDLPPPVDDDTPDPDAPPVVESTAADVEAEPAAADPSPQEVLDRLTQYATATRAATPPEPQSEPQPEPSAPAAATPPPPEPASPRADDEQGDDILPRTKRSPRGKRRD